MPALAVTRSTRNPDGSGEQTSACLECGHTVVEHTPPDTRPTRVPPREQLEATADAIADLKRRRRRR